MDMIAVERALERLIPCKYCGNTDVTAETRTSQDVASLRGMLLIRVIHRCPPNIYEGTWYYTIDDAINEWNAYNAPSDEVLEAWNRENAPSPTPAGKTPILADLPALPMPKRGKRQLETAKVTLDLDIVELEVSFREMRSYKDNNLFNNREETVTLRARLKPGQTPEEIYQALRERAGQFVEKAHADFEAEKQAKEAESLITKRMLNSFVSPRGPSYYSPNNPADDMPF